jgi:hypothetical protein
MGYRSHFELLRGWSRLEPNQASADAIGSRAGATLSIGLESCRLAATIPRSSISTPRAAAQHGNRHKIVNVLLREGHTAEGRAVVVLHDGRARKAFERLGHRGHAVGVAARVDVPMCRRRVTFWYGRMHQFASNLRR